MTHGGTARATIGTLLGFDPDLYWRLAPLGNCRWSLLADMGRGWRLEEHNAGQPPAGGDRRRRPLGAVFSMIIACCAG